MAIQNWSDSIVVVELQDDPAFTDDVTALSDLVDNRKDVDVLMNFGAVSFLNSSNIAKLLRLRKQVVVSNHRRLLLCGINTHVWGVFLVTGLDKLFEFADDISSGLATVQMAQ